MYNNSTLSIEEYYIKLCDYYLEEVRYYKNPFGEFVIDSDGDHAKKLFERSNQDHNLADELLKIIKGTGKKILILSDCPGSEEICPHCKYDDRFIQYDCPTMDKISEWTGFGKGFPEGCVLNDVEFLRFQ